VVSELNAVLRRHPIFSIDLFPEQSEISRESRGYCPQGKAGELNLSKTKTLLIFVTILILALMPLDAQAIA
jgi:hypothetical protein